MQHAIRVVERGAVTSRAALLPGALGDEAMTTSESELGPGLGPRKPRAELRHWSTYTSVGE